MGACAGSQRSSVTTSSTWSTGIRATSYPGSLTRYIRDRDIDDDRHHAEIGFASASFVTDDVVDRLAIVGPPQEHVRRLKELSEAGVDQFNLYLMSGDEERQLEVYGSTIIPALKAALGEA